MREPKFISACMDEARKEARTAAFEEAARAVEAALQDENHELHGIRWKDDDGPFSLAFWSGWEEARERAAAAIRALKD